MQAESSGVRIDVWLWAARFFKTRSLAKQAVVGGRVTIDDQACKPARLVRVGDHLTVRRGEEVMRISVLGLSETRGPATAARQLYHESDEARATREAAREQQRLAARGFTPPATRPDSKARRQLRRLLEG